MTEVECIDFIEKVLQGLWTNWEPGDLESEIWKKELRNCDYGRAKKAISNWYVTASQPFRKPPLGKLRRVLVKTWVESAKKKEPVLLYTIVLDILQKRGYDFYAEDNTDIPVPEEINRQAEQNLRNIQLLRGEKPVIIYRKS